MASLVKTTEFVNATVGIDPAIEGAAIIAIPPTQADANIFTNPNLILITIIPEPGFDPVILCRNIEEKCLTTGKPHVPFDMLGIAKRGFRI
jgi:hypothetical protein